MAVEGMEEFSLDNFSQGLDRSDDPRNIAENATPNTENTRFFGQVWTSRPGYESYLDELSTIKGFDAFDGWDKNNSLISVLGGKVYRADDANDEWVEITMPDVLTEGEDVNFVEYLGDMYLGNAVEPFYRLEHTTYTVTEPAGAPKGNILNSWAEKMWVCGNRDNPRTLYYSRTALADHPEYIYDFGGDGSGSELLGKKGVLTGLNNTKNAQVIFKDNETYYVRTFDTTTLAPKIDELSNDVGCVGNKAHVKVKDDVYFFTGSEVRIVTEFEGYPNLYTASISKSIRRLIRDELNTDQSGAVLNYNAKDNLLKLWVRSVDSPVNDICLVYHMDNENKTWTIDRGKTASQAVTFRDNTYWGAASFGQVYLDERGLTDDGGPITSFRWSKNRKLYSAKGQKKFREYYFAGSMTDDTELIVRIYIDGRLAKEVTITSDDCTDSPEVLTGPVGTDPVGTQPIGGVLINKKTFQKRIRFNKIGRYIETYVEQSSLGGYHEVTDEIFRYIPLPRVAERI